MTGSQINTPLNYHCITIRSRRPEMFFKMGVLKNFAIFTGEHLCWKERPKKSLQQRCFLVKYCKIFKNTLFTEHLWTTASVLYCTIVPLYLSTDNMMIKLYSTVINTLKLMFFHFYSH